MLAPFGEKIGGFSSYSDAGWINYTKLNGINLPLLTAASIDPLDASWWFTAGASLLHYNISSNNIETISPNTLAGNYTQIQFSKDGIFGGYKTGKDLFKNKIINGQAFRYPSII